MHNPVKNVDIFQAPQFWTLRNYGDRCFYYDVFVSHARDDGSHELVAALTKHGVRVWYDERQLMDDARWSTRIVWGLRNSCVVLCIVGSKLLEDHTWVRTEVRAAKAAGDAAGGKRVFFTQIAEAVESPQWFTNESVCQFPSSGDLSEVGIERLAKKIRDMNRVSVSAAAPPLEALIARSQSVRSGQENRANRLRNSSETDWQRLLRHVNAAFDFVGNHASIDEIDAKELSELLYNVEVMSYNLRPFEAISVGLDEREAARLSCDLAMLASVPIVSDGYRAAVYVALRNIVDAGVQPARAALKSCLKWEKSQDLVRLVADELARHPDARDRDDAALILLKCDDSDGRNKWVLDELFADDNALRLRYHARRLSDQKVEELSTGKKAEEFEVRVSIAASSGDIIGLELALRDALSVARLSWLGTGNLFKILPQHSIEDSLRFSSFVSNSIDLWPDGCLISLWKLPFESCLFGPLRALHYLHGSRGGAHKAIVGCLSKLETPLRTDEQALSIVPGELSNHLVNLVARLELDLRKLSIERLRKGGTISRDGDLIDVIAYDRDLESKSYKMAREIQKMKSIIAIGAPSDLHSHDAQTFEDAIELTRTVVLKWNNIPYC